ncbi:MAG: sigma-54 dependent transcriptional regulator [Gemmatimonadota bacterium]
MSDVAKILVVDDHPANVKALRARLAADGHAVLEATNGPEALALVESENPDLVLLDVMMPGMDGYEVCRRIKTRTCCDFVPVILVTALSEAAAIVRGLSEGADEYVTKPFNPLELAARVKSMLRIRRMYQENTCLRREIAGKFRFDQLIGEAPAMEKVYAVLPKVTESNVTVLLSGESGTGKEAVARCIHYNGPRREGRFVAVNCGALSEGLLESELFGHRKGAFTGATETRAGLFEAADGGTIFLDEIGETSPAMQTRLLRVLQEGEITRVGETEPYQVHVRVIAATNRDLEAEVRSGGFREDLYYRLSVFPIRLPALRERREDIPRLAAHFLERHAARAGKAGCGLSPRALDALARYDWPGNVRELENEIERALVLASPGEVIDADLLSEKLGARPDDGPRRRQGRLRDILAGVEREVIEEAMGRLQGNKSHMAEHLGITRYTLLQKMREYGLEG